MDLAFDDSEQPVLDHGYVRFVEHWGSDARIIESARMSTDKGFLGWGNSWRCSRALCDWTGAGDRQARHRHDSCEKCGASEIVFVEGDEKLLRYLYENKHSTPFEFAGLTLEIQAPIFVFREWHRHRTQSYSELSARYTPMPNLNYVPTVERLMLVSSTNKQAMSAKGAGKLTLDTALAWLARLQASYDLAEEVYQEGLALGVPKELARCPVPVARYSRMRATANLRNWLAFLTLRNAPSAQWEIQQYAQAVEDEIRTHFPRTHTLFLEGRPI